MQKLLHVDCLPYGSWLKLKKKITGNIWKLQMLNFKISVAGAGNLVGTTEN